LVFSAALAIMLCCQSATSQAEKSAEANAVSSNEKMTQIEAERSALAGFVKSSPDCKIKSYIFEKLVHIQNPEPNLAMNGFFLCGNMAYMCFGKLHGPSPIMVNFSNNKILNLILYDYPERGAHPASSLCNQVKEIDSNR